MGIEDARNFVAVQDGLATAGQPTEEQLADAARQGFDVIVNLGLLDPRYCLADERGSVETLGMEYHHVPVDFKAPRFTDLERFFDVMDAAARKKVFVHCAANYRVSSFVALYAQARLGWSRDQADALIKRTWVPNETWVAFIADCRRRLASGD